MSAIAEFGDKLAGLTLKEAVELKDYLKEKYNIEPAGGGMMAAPAAGPAAPAALSGGAPVPVVAGASVAASQSA